MRTRLLSVLPALGVVLAGAVPAVAGEAGKARMSLGGEVDCSDTTIGYEERPGLTEAERIAGMERALYRALNRFDACQTAVQAATNAGGGADGGANGGNGGNIGGDGGADAAAAGAKGSSAEATGGMDGKASVASADMAGTEARGKSEGEGTDRGEDGDGRDGTGMGTVGLGEEQGEYQANADPSDPSAPRQDGAMPPGEGRVALGNGRTPADIPPAANDSILEAQIRKAAMNETDPEKRARLWDEYRRYKGLAPK